VIVETAGTVVTAEATAGVVVTAETVAIEVTAGVITGINFPA
jgi:hypothetical protein